MILFSFVMQGVVNDELYDQSWAVGVGATVIQNQLQHHLPASLLSSLSTGEDISYTIIPHIKSFTQPLQSEVRDAFARSIDIFWQALLVFCGMGLLSTFFQKDVPLHEQMDGTWQLEDRAPQASGDVSGVVSPMMIVERPVSTSS